MTSWMNSGHLLIDTLGIFSAILMKVENFVISCLPYCRAPLEKGSFLKWKNLLLMRPPLTSKAKSNSDSCLPCMCMNFPLSSQPWKTKLPLYSHMSLHNKDTDHKCMVWLSVDVQFSAVPAQSSIWLQLLSLWMIKMTTIILVRLIKNETTVKFHYEGEQIHLADLLPFYFWREIISVTSCFLSYTPSPVRNKAYSKTLSFYSRPTDERDKTFWKSCLPCKFIPSP